MRYLTTIFLLTLTLAACGRHDHESQSGEEDEGPPGTAITRWTDRSELFMEHKLLVAGRETSFAVHLTELAGSKPVVQGSVVLEFTGSESPAVFRAEAPASPGIFRPLATLKTGKYRWRLLVRGPQVQDAHDLGEVQVYPSVEAARDANPPQPEPSGRISFLKEQQWKGGFSVQEVRPRELVESLRVQGQVRAPLGRPVKVLAPASGIFQPGDSVYPVLGASVAEGQTIGFIESDSPSVTVASPLSGAVAVAYVTPGDRVEKGMPLFDLVDLSTIWVEAGVYEPDLPKVPAQARAAIEGPGGRRLASSKFLGQQGSMDSASRTAKVLFAFPNPGGAFKLGAVLSVDILTRESSRGPVLPASAVVDEDGKAVAFVQVEGESFERRVLRLGTREGDWIRALDGVLAGERVVVDGAYLVRLAAASPRVPEHGHAH
ncbi:MAG: efflux RND transporter periplasmic adaptor subunit [Elusimicrobia bacterium]|nr:efflux RND transporter periplasmic adaptor subunit [Elusimicrobiota bacterium]